MTNQAEEIYERRQWFQTTLESIGDAVIACDKDGNVESVGAKYDIYAFKDGKLDVTSVVKAAALS